MQPTRRPRYAGRILLEVFGHPSPHPSSPRRPFSDAAAAEVALVNYFLRLGHERLRLPLPFQPLEGKQARRAPFPSAAPEAAEGVPPPAKARPSCHLDSDAFIPTTSYLAGEEKAAVLKRGRPPSSDSCRFLSSTADDRSWGSNKSRVTPSAANHAGGMGSLDAGGMAGGPPLGDRGARKLSPSILCPANWEDEGAGDVGGARVWRRESPLQAEQEAGGRVPAVAALAPRASSPVGRSSPAENARTVSSARVAGLEEQSPGGKGDAGKPRSVSVTVRAEEAPPSRYSSVV